MKTALPVLLSSLVLLLSTGCETTDARPIDAKGPGSTVALGQISPRDWDTAAEKVVQSLLKSGVLEKSPKQPAVMAVSRIVNNTQQQIDTNLLTKKIRIALNESGKVLTTTTLGMGGNAEDVMAKELGQLQDMRAGRRQETLIPDYTLSGRLIESQVKSGRTKEVTFTVQLSLTAVKSGLAVWEDEAVFGTVGTRPIGSW